MVALYEVLALLTLLGYIKVESSVTIAVAATTAIVGWHISVRIKARVDVESNASKDTIIALEKYSESLRRLYYGMVRYYAAVAMAPNPLPSHFWENAAREYYSRLYDDQLAIGEAQMSLRETIEANEMALIELEDLYDYIKFKHDDLISLFDKQGQIYAANIQDIDSLEGLNIAVEAFVKLSDKEKNTEFAIALAEQLVLCLDFKKVLLNKFQSKMFGRTLKKREPLNGTKTLEELATKKVMKKMRSERNAEFMEYVNATSSSDNK